MTYNIHKAFHIKGYFGVKATSLGENLCMLEEYEEGEIKALMTEAEDWIWQRFSEVHPWSPNDVDNKRLDWLMCYSIPYHTWSPELFEFLTFLVGVCVFFMMMRQERKKV